MRRHVILSVFKRNFLSYFSGVLGYLFIVVFVVAGAALAFNARFFTANEPNLDQLSQWFPLLLLFIIPAITMSTWADEKKLGTDELLFTLPATDLEILLGKYLAVLAVYTVALAFSVTHLFVLKFLGDPDWGLIVTTYFGYWIAGGALLSAGMLASVLTSSATVAFVLGVVICALPVFIGYLGGFFGAREFFDGLSLREQFRDFGMGMIPLTGVLYFGCFTAFMLYLNLVCISRRHWGATQRTNMGLQFSVRSVSLVVILISACGLAGYAALGVDMTSERLFSLSRATSDIVDGLRKDHPVTIKVFASPDVPREYVETRKQLIGLLRRYDQLGGSLIEVDYYDVTPFSEEAEQATHFGIEPVTVMTERDGRRTDEDVFLGAVITSPSDEVIVPFFGKGLPIEYELTRSVQTVSNVERHTVGILRTDAQILSGSSEWQIVTELRKQYDIEEVSPSSAIDGGEFDVLIAVLPSSLTQMEMTNLVDHVRSGEPVLIFDDPLPLMFSSQFGVTNAPRLPKPSPGGGFGMMGMGGGRQPPEQKADGGKATSLMNVLDLHWDNGRAVFDFFNPHPEFGMLRPEYVFVTRASRNPNAFSTSSRITGGLQEIVAIYSGSIQHRGGEKDIKFEPLLLTGGESGLLEWEEYINESFNPFAMQSTAQLKRAPFREIDNEAHVLGAHITADTNATKLNVVYVSDIDMIADLFFQEWNRGDLPVRFDNVTFVLNAVDILAGDQSFVDLRTRRAKHRTLKRVEKQAAAFIEERNDEEKKADDEADDALKRAQESFDKRREAIENDDTLDEQAKRILLEQIAAAEKRRLEVAEANLEREKNDKIAQVKARTEREIRSIENGIRFWAVFLPAIPAICVGLLVLGLKLNAEQRNITPGRRRH